jgi:hypothetical protein
MIITAFTIIMGIVIGILATLAYALHLAVGKEPEAPSGIAATSVPSGIGRKILATARTGTRRQAKIPTSCVI